MNQENRKQRQFWAITEVNTVQKVTGYECPQDQVWWVPSLGYSMTEGHHLFDTADMAKARLKGNLRAQISKLEQQLAAIN